MSMNIDYALTLEQTLTLPVYMITGVTVLMLYLSDLSNNGMYLEYLNYDNFRGDLLNIIGDLNILSVGILNFHNDIHLTYTQSTELYRNLVSLHVEVENLFHETQNLIVKIEHLRNYFEYERIDSICNSYIGDSDRLREEGNLLIKALRSLEDSIISHNPSFQFLNKLWFE